MLALGSCCALLFLAARPAKTTHGRNTPAASPSPSPAPVVTPQIPAPAGAGFTRAAAWMADAYWRDGKAEFNTYDARIVRYGEARPCEVIQILVREDFAPNTMVKADNWQQPGTYPVLKLNQILHIPTGLYVYQQMHSSVLEDRGRQPDQMVADQQRLVRQHFQTSPSLARTKASTNRPPPGSTSSAPTGKAWKAARKPCVHPSMAYFYEELPALVRIDRLSPLRTGHLSRSFDEERDQRETGHAEFRARVGEFHDRP